MAYPRAVQGLVGLASVAGLVLFFAAGCRQCAEPAVAPPSPVAPPAEAPAAPVARAPIIDVHTHIASDAYPQALALADRNGVQRIVNLSGGHQARPEGFARHLAAIGAWPGRVAVFYNLVWRAVNAAEFGPRMAEGLEDAVRQGYAGLKIPKVLGLGVVDLDGHFIAVDDARFDPIWRKAGELGVPVSIHTSDPKAFFEPLTPENERYEELSAAPDWSFADPKYPRRAALLAQRDRMIARHPDTTFILVHFANNPEDLDDVERVLTTYPNALVDLSARIGEIGRHDPAKVRALFVKFKDRILFGTDMGVHLEAGPDGQEVMALFLGSLSRTPPQPEDVDGFFAAHFAFLEQDSAKVGEIPHPVPIQGPWKVRPIHLPPDVLQAVYHDNAYRVIFAPMFKRRGEADPVATPR